MIYRVTSINTQMGSNIHQHSVMNGGPYSVNSDSPVLTLDVTIEILEPERNMLRSLEDFEAALNGYARVEDNAPTYKELLEKYHPEYLL
jgi:hypothetical protein